MRKPSKIAVELVLLSFVFLVTLAVNTKSSQACSTTLPPKGWTPPATTEERVNMANVIVEGTVTYANYDMSDYYVTIRVDRYFKGAGQTEFGANKYDPQIFLNYHCSVRAPVGHHAIFYAQLTEYGILSIDYTTTSGEDYPSPEIAAKIIALVGHTPDLPQADTNPDQTSSTTLIGPAQTPPVTSGQSAVNSLITPEAGKVKDLGADVDFSWLSAGFGLFTFLIVFGFMVWLGNKQAKKGEK